jgi:hypothetical protein
MPIPVKPLPTEDLDHVLAHTEGLWEELRGQRIFITGGTGFFGCWLLESFAWANDHLGLNASAVVLTRNPKSFAAKMPHLAGRSDLIFIAGDVRDFSAAGRKSGVPTADISAFQHFSFQLLNLDFTGQHFSVSACQHLIG